MVSSLGENFHGAKRPKKTTRPKGVKFHCRRNFIYTKKKDLKFSNVFTNESISSHRYCKKDENERRLRTIEWLETVHHLTTSPDHRHSSLMGESMDGNFDTPIAYKIDESLGDSNSNFDLLGNGPKPVSLIMLDPSEVAQETGSKKKSFATFSKNPFVIEVMNEMGNLLENYKSQDHDKSLRSENSLSRLTLYDMSEGLIGAKVPVSYQFPHGPELKGTSIDGKMEGQGTLTYPNGGVLRGYWVRGKMQIPDYTFGDGLKFDVTDWKYCQMPDRRFMTEIRQGLRSPNNMQFANDHPARVIPDGYIETGEGFYNPRTKYLIHPATGKVIRIVNAVEERWILQFCRTSWDSEVPFSRVLYENWYPGTAFDNVNPNEPEWFKNEFPPLKVDPECPKPRFVP